MPHGYIYFPLVAACPLCTSLQSINLMAREEQLLHEILHMTHMGIHYASKAFKNKTYLNSFK